SNISPSPPLSAQMTSKPASARICRRTSTISGSSSITRTRPREVERDGDLVITLSPMGRRRRLPRPAIHRRLLTANTQADSHLLDSVTAGLCGAKPCAIRDRKRIFLRPSRQYSSLRGPPTAPKNRGNNGSDQQIRD